MNPNEPTDARKRIEDVLKDHAEGRLTKDAAIDLLLNDRVQYALKKLNNLCRTVQEVRAKQNEYFATRNSKVLVECQRMEKDLDTKLRTFFEIEKKRLNPELPLQ